jgi:hypothetical protein
MEKPMTRSKRLTVGALAPLIFLLASTAARADSYSVSLVLSQPYQNVSDDGATLEFEATVANLGTGLVFFTGDSFTNLSPLVLNDSPFWDNFPPSLEGAGALDGGDSYTDVLFTVTVPSGTPPGLYSGDFVLQGGGDGYSQSVLATADFIVDVNSDEVPEPDTLLLMGAVMLGLPLLRRLRI